MNCLKLQQFDVYILNLIDFNDGLKINRNFSNQNKHTNIGYHNTETENVMEYKSKLLFLRKTFQTGNVA